MKNVPVAVSDLSPYSIFPLFCFSTKVATPAERESGPVNGDECYFWRTTGCSFGKECRYKHIPSNKGIDKKPWQKWTNTDPRDPVCWWPGFHRATFFANEPERADPVICAVCCSNTVRLLKQTSALLQFAFPCKILVVFQSIGLWFSIFNNLIKKSKHLRFSSATKIYIGTFK
jgi:hypothetical protein